VVALLSIASAAAALAGRERTQWSCELGKRLATERPDDPSTVVDDLTEQLRELAAAKQAIAGKRLAKS
jgi:hypothetical protein